MDERQGLVGRREIITAVLLAAERAPFILELLSSTHGDVEAVRDVLTRRLEITELQAEVIIGLQFRRLTPRSVEQSRNELATIEQRLQELDQP